MFVVGADVDFDVLPQRFLVEKLTSSKWLLDKVLKQRGIKRLCFPAVGTAKVCESFSTDLSSV